MTAIEEALAAGLAVATTFIEAAGQKDEDTARAACTVDGWENGDGPARGLFRTIGKKGLVVQTMGSPRKLGHRAAQWVVLSHPSRPKPLGDLWFLLERDTSGWHISGITKLRPVVGLFLWNEVEGALSVANLERSPEAEAWAAPMLAALQDGELPTLDHGTELLHMRAAVDDVEVKALRTVQLPAANRAACGFLFTEPDDPLGYDVWIVLDTTTPGAPVVIDTRPSLGLESLLLHLDLDWPHEDPDEEGKALTGDENRTDPDGARRMLEDSLYRMAEKDGVDLDSLPDDDPRSLALAALRSLKRTPSGPPPAPNAEPRNVQLPAELTRALSATLSRQIAEGKIDGDEVDSDYLLSHGAEVIAGLIGNILREVAPGGLQVTVPVQSEDGSDLGPDAPQRVKMKVDLAEMLEKLAASRSSKEDQ